VGKILRARRRAESDCRGLVRFKRRLERRYRRVGGAKETAAARLIARVPGPRAFLAYQHIITARKLASSEHT